MLNDHPFSRFARTKSAAEDLYFDLDRMLIISSKPMTPAQKARIRGQRFEHNNG